MAHGIDLENLTQISPLLLDTLESSYTQIKSSENINFFIVEVVLASAG